MSTDTAPVATIDLDHVVALGNVDEALADFYSTSVAAVAAGTGTSEREIRQWVEDELISENGFRTQALTGPGDRGVAVLLGLEDRHVIRADSRRGAEWYELSHDRLVGPVRDSNHAWNAANLSPLQIEAMAWERQGRPDALLMTGPSLAAAAEWAESHPDAIEAADAEFLAASQTAEHEAMLVARASRRARVFALVAIVLALFALLGGWFAYTKTQDNDRLAASRDEAESAAAEAETARAEAEASAEEARSATAEAEAARAEAEASAEEARSATAEAEAARAEAEELRREAEASAAEARCQQLVAETYRDSAERYARAFEEQFAAIANATTLEEVRQLTQLIPAVSLEAANC